MAIPVLSVSSSGGMAAAAAALLLGQERVSQAAQAQVPSVPDPSVIVTLGSAAPTLLTYNAAGLLAALDNTTITAAGNDANSQTLAGLLAGQAQLLAVGFDAGASASGGIDGTGVLQTTLASSTTQALSDLATADVNLATAAMGAGTTATAATVSVASALGEIQNFPAASASQIVSALPSAGLTAAATASPTPEPSAATINAQVSSTSSTSSVNAGQAVSAAPTISVPPAAAAATTSVTAAGFYNANAVLQSLLTDAAARALSTLATDPAYAAGAAALYASAGLVPSRLNESQNLLPHVVSVIQPVLPIRGVGRVAAA